MERKHKGKALVISLDRAYSDASSVDVYIGYTCINYPMRLIGYSHVGGYPYNNSIQKWNDLAKVRTAK